MKTLFTSTFIFIFNMFYAQNWEWASSFGNVNNDNATSMAIDPSGNVFVAGSYFNTSISIGANILNNSGGGDLYIAKYSPSGTVMWAQNISGTGSEFLGSICTGTNGNVYVCGTFDSPTINVAGYTLTRSGTLSNIFIACYSSSGSSLWAYSYGNGASPYSSDANSCAYSPSENCLYVTGSFTGTLAIGATTLNNPTTSSDIFLAKFSIASLSASPVWAIKTGASNSDDLGQSIEVDNSANIYIGGTFAPLTSTSVIGAAVTSQGAQDIFIVKYNNAGTYQWVKTFGTTNGNEYIYDIALDASSNVYACGSYNAASLMFPSGSYTLTNMGINDGFFTKFNSAGTFQWANKIGGVSGSDYINGISTDASNNVYLTGSYGSLLTSIGSSTYTVPSSNSSNSFVAKFSTSNVFQWALSSTGTASVSGYARAITNDNSNNIYSCGSFYSYVPITFGTSTLTSIGTNDAYVTKISCITPTITASNASYTVCANSVNSFTPFINSPQNDVTYNWNIIGASGVNLSNITGTLTSISYTGTTTFSIVVTGTNACSNVSVTAGVVKVNALPNVSASASPTAVCTGSLLTLNGSGAASYVWSNSVTNGVAFTPSGFATYTVTGTDANGCQKTNTISVSALSNPAISVTGQNLICLNKPNTLTASGASTYTWLPNSSVSPTIIAQPTVNTTYTVNATASNGCNGTSTFIITLVTPVTPSICEVSADSVSHFNYVMWDKTTYTNVDSFIVYREVSSAPSTYVRIGAQPYSAYSRFKDTARHIGPANGDPNITSYRYKLQLRDSCGNYSSLSPYHNTVYFISNNGTYSWNQYTIQGQPNPVTTYDLFRDNFATNTWTYVGSCAGSQTSLNDPAYATYSNTAVWRVDANGFNCNPTQKLSSVYQQVAKSKSNVKNNFNVPFDPTAGIKTFEFEKIVTIAPNPTKDEITISFKEIITDKTTFILTDVIGQQIYTNEITNDSKHVINVSNLNAGVYFLSIIQSKNKLVKKIIKE